jgi:uracil-DNA glycosylase family 4
VSPELPSILTQAKQWLNQERLWDNQMHARLPDAIRVHTQVPQPLLAPKPVTPAAAPVPARRPVVASVPQAVDSDKATALNALYEQYKGCVRCSLGLSRIRFVFGVGHPNSRVMFIGEGPGYEEDRRGEPFIGKAGQLLDKMMASIGLSRQTNAYIANIVKCHPMTNPQTPEARGNDRPPTPEEVATCSPILLRQIAIIQPKVIMTLGSPSTKMVLKTVEGISKIRGRLFPFPVDAFYPPSTATDDSAPPMLSAELRATLAEIQVLPTYHPAALLRNPDLKSDSWSDLKLLRDTFFKTS